MGVTWITGVVLGSKSQKALYLEVPDKFSVYDNLSLLLTMGAVNC